MTDLTFFSSAEVAQMLKVKVGTLAHWRCKGIGPPWRKVGARVLYNHQDLVKYLESK